MPFISPPKKAAFYSIASGMTLIAFWSFLYQTKNESNLPLSDITDVFFENTAENEAENKALQNNQTTNQDKIKTYRDGTYEASAGTPWGTLTTVIAIKDGQWSKVSFKKVPPSPPSEYAASYLANQALKAQNEKIHGVSGATYTSDAFRDDLKQIVKQSKI